MRCSPCRLRWEVLPLLAFGEAYASKRHCLHGGLEMCLVYKVEAGLHIPHAPFSARIESTNRGGTKVLRRLADGGPSSYHILA